MTSPTLIQVKLWLKSKNVLEKVSRRFKEHSCITIETAFDREHSNMLNAFITWSETPEGHSFWEDLDTQLRKFYSNPTSYKFIECESLFKPKEIVKIKDSLSSEFVEINEEMNNFCGEAVQISFIDIDGYCPYKTGQDGCFYYIKEDNEINAFTSEMFERVKK